MKNSVKTPLDRLNYIGNLHPVIVRLCEAYKIGDLIDFSIIDIGYEDCNVIIKTSKGKYVAKIFSKNRNQEDIIRYGKIMEEAIKANAGHPLLFKTKNNQLIFSDDKAKDISMVLMEFISGNTFFELNCAPNLKELKKVIELAAKVNKIDYKPSYLFDSWAIPNIKEVFDQIKPHIQNEDIELIKKTVDLYSEIPVDKLPHCFVHGDFTKANVLKGDDGKIYILDFSVSNWYPRIQELAVISANLLYDENNSSLRKRVEIVLNEYDKFNPLTIDEKRYLYNYALAGLAMEFMGAYREKFIKGNATKETEYWLNLGRNGLKKEYDQK